MKLRALYRAAKEQGKADLCRFMRDMRRAGRKLFYYRGRFFWKGPAVGCDRLQDVLSHTKVPCQWDHLGRGFVVYPNQSLATPHVKEIP